MSTFLYNAAKEAMLMGTFLDGPHELVKIEKVKCRHWFGWLRGHPSHHEISVPLVRMALMTGGYTVSKGDSVQLMLPIVLQ